MIQNLKDNHLNKNRIFTMVQSRHAYNKPANPENLTFGQIEINNQFMSKVFKIISGVAKRYNMNFIQDFEDEMQETGLAVLKVFKSGKNAWDPSKGSLSTWIGRIFLNKCFDKIRKDCSRIRILKSRIIMEKNLRLAEAYNKPQEQGLHFEELKNEMLEEISKNCNPRQLEVYSLLCQNLNGRKIIKMTGYPVKQVYNDLKKIRHVLKKLIQSN